MKKFSKFIFLVLSAFAVNIFQISAQTCIERLIAQTPPTYTIPTPQGRTTASALLAENNLSKLETFSNCTIHIAAGVDFEVDVPLALSEVTIIVGKNGGIKVERKQTLVITYCNLIPEGDNYWNGILLEDETAKLYMENAEIDHSLNFIQTVLQSKNNLVSKTN